MLRLNTLVTIILFVFVSRSYGREYKGFIKLNPAECIPLESKIVSFQFPVEWHKYVGFVKICNLKQKDGKAGQISIISIWAHDYLKTLQPNAPWEKFPLPIITDNNLNEVGQLNEIYPSDWVTDLNVYYGKWNFDIPGEIRVDVDNPAVSGDYYYDPMVWNEKNRHYEVKSKDIISGRRSK